MLSPYEYVEQYGNIFAKFLGYDFDLSANSYHADKADQYSKIFEHYGISPNEGALIYCLSYEQPFYNEIRGENPTISIQDWFRKIFVDSDIMDKLCMVFNHSNNLNLIKFSERLNEYFETGDKESFIEFRKNFPKLNSDNFYSESIYDSSEYGNKNYIYNIKNVGFNNSTSIYFQNDIIKATNARISLRPANISEKMEYYEHASLLNGYIVTEATKLLWIENLLSAKLGISSIFIEAYLNVYSGISLEDIQNGNDNFITIDSETKVVKLYNMNDVILKYFKNIDLTNESKLTYIKAICKE